jgi:hypothetical protein
MRARGASFWLPFWLGFGVLAVIIFFLVMATIPTWGPVLWPQPTIADPETGGGKVTVEIVGHWPCLEDEVLVGVGGFRSDGWDGWRCENREGLRLGYFGE